SKVVVLNADAPTSTSASSTASVSQPAAAATTSVSAPIALPDTKATAKPTPLATTPTETKPVATAKPATTSIKPAEATKPAAPTKPAAAGVGFAVQLGAFGSADEANKLRDRARAAGFSAFVQEVRTDKGMLSRVRIGPVVNRADAEQLMSQVSAKLGVSGIVQSHP
ncbi:MAG: SPOR domain-containing protein, partial [Lysobacter sp.]